MDEDETQTDKIPTSDILITSQTLSFSGTMVEKDKEKL